MKYRVIACFGKLMVNWKHLNHGRGFWIGREGSLRIRVKLNSLLQSSLKKSKSVVLFYSECLNYRIFTFRELAPFNIIHWAKSYFTGKLSRQIWSWKIEGRLKKKKKRRVNILFDPSIPPCLLQISRLFYLSVNYAWPARRGEGVPGGTRRIPWPNLIIPDRG